MSKDMITIKGTKDGLIILVNTNYEFQEVKNKLHQKFQSSKGFFSGAKFALYSNNQYSYDEENALIEICCDHGLIPNEKLQNKVGEYDNEIEMIVMNNKTLNSKNESKKIINNNNNIGAINITSKELDEKTIFIKHNLHNGQIIRYDGNVIILGDINPGASIIASGNILVMGALKGIAHAGATGNRKSIIVAYILNPTQLRISNIFAYSPKQKKTKDFSPEVAYLKNNQIIIKKYISNKSNLLAK